MRADLHIHTYYSDGKYPPEELARRAKAAGLSLISLTDHDSLAGLNEKRAAAEGEGLSFVSGWEVSAYEGEAKVHVLGYGCLPDAAYEDFLEERRRGALARAESVLQGADIVTFSSAGGVRALLSRVSLPETASTVAIGEETARALKGFGFSPSVADSACAESLVQAAAAAKESVCRD